MTDVTIRVRDNGPLVIEGPVKLIDAEGNGLPVSSNEKLALALCRCGVSGSKPYCDGSHREAQFTSKVRAGEP